MTRRLIVVAAALVLAPAPALAWTETSHWNTDSEGGWSCFDRPPGGHGIVTADEPDAPDPAMALSIVYPKDWTYGGEPATCSKRFPSIVREYWVQYWFKYSLGYQWNPIANKQTYFMADRASGYRNNYWIGVMNHTLPDNTTVERTIVLENQGVSGGNLFSNSGFEPTIVDNRWYRLVHHFIANTPGLADGVAEIWLDGRLVMSHTGVQLIDENNTGIEEMQITPVYGGIGGDPKQVEDYQYYDFVIVSTSPLASTSCPDGSCAGGETCSTCPADCGACPVDGGSVDDAGAISDAGWAVDAGAGADAGSVVDAGATADAGSAVDAGAGADAGSVVDAGATADAGSAVDAGAGSDAGSVADAGGEGGLTGSGSCGCGAVGGGSAVLTALLLLAPLRRPRLC